MRKYFGLQLKLAARQFPFVLAVTVALVVGICVILSGLMDVLYNDDAPKQYTVGITGDTDDTYLQWGLTALQSMDADRFSFVLQEMPEDAAQRALEKGEIAAYAIFPQDFMEKALMGEMTPITYVTSAGMQGAADLLKKEITQMITDIVVQSQKGAFGLEAVMRDRQLEQGMYDHMTALSLRYTDLIFHRDALYTVEELGISDSLSTRDYYLCACIVILLVLTGIPFATVYIRKDYAMPRLLLSRGFPAVKQLLCEFCVYLLSMLTLAAVVVLLGAGLLERILPPESGELPELGKVTVRVIPVAVMLAAMNMLLFTCCNHLVSGLLLHFFVAVGLCFVSGCIYPVYAFPQSLWTVAEWLPTGLARRFIATGFSGASAAQSLGGIALYAVAFCGITLWVRVRKTAGYGR